MSGRLRILLIVAFVMSPVTADLRNGLVWSDAWGQQYRRGYWGRFPYCRPVKINLDNGSQVTKATIWDFDGLASRCSPPEIPWCVRTGWCISEERVDFGAFSASKVIPNGCLQRACRKQSFIGVNQ